MRVQKHERLIVWQRAMELVCAVYEITRRLPREERYGLTNQMRRAATSIPANIAEGHARTRRKDFLQFLAIAAASLTELETHLVVVQRIGFLRPLDTATTAALADEVGRMLTAMRKRLSAPAGKAARR